MKTILLSIVLLLSTSCAAQEIKPRQLADTNGQAVTTCTYKYDSKMNIEFLPRDKNVYRPSAFPTLTVYKIVDIYGKHWLVNEYEWSSYTCNTNIR